MLNCVTFEPQENHMAESFYIGMDLCPESTQISFYNDIKREPETVNQLNNKETYMMPNILFFSKATGDWFVGSEASEARFKEDGVILDSIYDGALSDDHIEVDDKSYSAKQLFLMMLRMHIDTFLYRYEGATVKKLVVTVPTFSKRLFRVLKGLYKELNVPEDCVVITSHMESALYYVFNQESDLYVNSVALFDYGTEGLKYFRIDRERTNGTNVIRVAGKDYSSQFNMAMFMGDDILMDEAFAKIVGAEMKQTYISSVFLAGLGFSEKWMNHSRNILCQGRRVFAGQNIYTKGACYKAVGGEYEEFYKTNLVETSENVPFDIGISSGGEKDEFLTIAEGGTQWYNIKGKINVILDDTDTITILYRDRKTGEITRDAVKLFGIPKRPNKTSKFSVEVEFDSRKNGAVIIRDVGFGKLFPTTNKIYRKEF